MENRDWGPEMVMGCVPRPGAPRKIPSTERRPRSPPPVWRHQPRGRHQALRCTLQAGALRGLQGPTPPLWGAAVHGLCLRDPLSTLPHRITGPFPESCGYPRPCPVSSTGHGLGASCSGGQRLWSGQQGGPGEAPVLAQMVALGGHHSQQGLLFSEQQHLSCEREGATLSLHVPTWTWVTVTSR